MDELTTVIIYSYGSGCTVLAGGLLGRLFDNFRCTAEIKAEIVHTSIAFGGGIIIAAVALVLVPEGMASLPAGMMTTMFTAGTLAFFALDRTIEKKGGSLAQLLAMLLDFIPEAIALGAVFARHNDLGLLLAILIGIQNLPESFNSYRDLKKSGVTTARALALLFVLSFAGVFAAVSGYLFLSEQEEMTAALMLFASGGILYLIFQDIAPMSRMKNRWFPALGAGFGFLVGMFGQKLVS